MKSLSKNAKMLIIIICAVVLIIALFFGIKALSESIRTKAKNAEKAEEISGTMEKYGLSDYEVVEGSKILCKDFEHLSNSDKLKLVKELSSDIYVNSRDYYYYISPLWATMPQNNYTCGGLYKYDGNRYCVLEE